MNRSQMTPKEWDAYKEKVLDIRNFKQDGFEHVCDVDPQQIGRWQYKNINKSLMFSEHASWVYMIVLEQIIVKLGETGNPLGISEYYRYGKYEAQPKASSQCRLGRLRTGDGTDSYIRENLAPYIRNGHAVSIWAKKCPIKSLTESIGGTKSRVQTSIHKSLEQAYLKYFQNKIGQYPWLNKAGK